MGDKTYCLKHYRQTFLNKGCDMCGIEDAAEGAQKMWLKEAEENAKLEAFVDRCKSLTGSLWPQNETTAELAKAIKEIK